MSPPLGSAPDTQDAGAPSPAVRRTRRRTAGWGTVLLAGILAVYSARAATRDQVPYDLEVPDPAVLLRPAVLTELEDLSCGECHARVVEEWASTAHALSWLDEVYQESIGRRRRPELCHACHIPGPLLTGEKPGRPAAREASLHLGVSCDTCHLASDGAILGAGSSETDAHVTRRSEFLSGAGLNELCASCHSTSIGPVIGIAKDFVASEQARRGRSCVGCHMAALESTGDDAEVGPVIRSHSLQTPRDPAFLRRAFALSLTVEGRVSRIAIANTAGHRVPGLIGRKIRFEAQALDSEGQELATGSLTIDVRAHIPVDGNIVLELAAGAASVTVEGWHLDPRSAEEVRFLSLTLEPEGG
ncbi:MAG: multiheme c-type cytochrome [Longimicrobiales bacterium]